MKVALLCDSPDERWPSMDIVGDMLFRYLPAQIEREQVLRPIRRLTPNFSLNRILLRFVDYPRWVRQNRGRFDLFHITDHSYSQLALELPPERTVITCHDIDTFRSVLQPERDPRPFLFRAMTRRILNGFKQAAHVACDSAATLADLARFGVIPPNRLSVVPLGFHPSCSPDPNPVADARANELLGPPDSRINLLHVGSTIERKRIGDLLSIFAAVRAQVPEMRLVRVGGELQPEQQELAKNLGVENNIVTLPFLDRATLAAVYRRATLVLLPSTAEGFGLPIAEAMACGTPVVASDLAVLREVGGDQAKYVPAQNIPAWAAVILHLLQMRFNSPSDWELLRGKGLLQAQTFTWENYSIRMANVYNRLL